MKTTVIDKSKVKSFEDFKQLKWTTATPQQKANVYAAMAKMTASVKKPA